MRKFLALCVCALTFGFTAGGYVYAQSVTESESNMPESESTPLESESNTLEDGLTPAGGEPAPPEGEPNIPEGESAPPENATTPSDSESALAAPAPTYVDQEVFKDGEWYYYDKNGVMATGWTTHHGNQYYYNENGQMVHGVYTVEGVTYGFDEWSGVLLGGEHFFADGRDDQWYYFYEADTDTYKKGQMATGWTAHHGNQYYYNENGQMVHGVYAVGDKYYGFNEWTGVLLTGEVFLDGAWRYFDENGVMATGWSEHHGNRYLYNDDGSMYYGELYLDGQWYYFHDVTGVMATGWTQQANRTGQYYYNWDGTMYHGELYLNNEWYYFDEWTGVMATGWTSHSGNTYYYDGNGRMAHGKYWVNGVEYYFDEWTGALKTGWRYENGYKVFYDANGNLCQNVDPIIGPQSSYFLKVNRTTNTVTVFAKDGANGYIIPVKKMICSTGLWNTPTIGGTYTLRRLSYWGTLVGPVYGQYITQIYNDYLFHSAWYYVNGNRKSLSVSEYRKLGNNASHGCVRLTVGDAKWIYDNCNGSTVYIYSGADTDPLYKPARPNPVVIRGDWGYDPTDPNVW